MSKLDDLHTLVRLLNEFEFPVSPILDYAIKKKEEELCADYLVKMEQTENVVGNELISFTSLKDEFSNYLYKTKSERTARNYLHYIEKPIRAYIENVVNHETDTVYSFQCVSEVKALSKKLRSNDSFVSDNLKWHNALTAAINSYLKFLEYKGYF